MNNIISKSEFISRFTIDELAKILEASKIDVYVESWKYLLDSLTEIDLTSEKFRKGMHLLVIKQLLTPARVEELSKPVEL